MPNVRISFGKTSPTSPIVASNWRPGADVDGRLHERTQTWNRACGTNLPWRRQV
jgi:hypothetical protein